MSKPALSICIPAYNEAATIGACVDSALRQAQRSDVEVLVCDDGSTDATPAIVEERRDERGLRVIHNARNQGILGTTQRLFDAAEGDAVLRIDGDCILDDGLVDAVLGAVEEGADIVFGRVSVANTDALHPAAAAIGHAKGDATQYGAACVAVRRGLVEPEDMTQNLERELRYLASRRGWTVKRLDIGVQSDFPTAIREWLPRKFDSGRVYLRECTANPSELSLWELRGPVWWTGMAGLLPLAIWTGLFAVGLWTVAVLVMYLDEIGPAYRVSGRTSVAAVMPIYRVVSGVARTAGVYTELRNLTVVLTARAIVAIRREPV